ncbi:MAG TPA: hypothetical protein VK363_00655 [Pyrinomonadaceae bacterium]|nr:hypothetical protein [Pyrinomonadaceae bacterium]
MSPHKTLLVAAFVLVMLSARVAHAQKTVETNCAPGVTFASLLNSVKIGYTDGRLSLDRLYAVCLPQPVRQSASNYPYDPEGGGKFSTVIKRADGQTLGTYVWYAESIGGLWELSRYKIVGGAQSLKPLSQGAYVLEFAIEDKLFYRFPFSVVEVRGDDPYSAPGQRYFVEGAWNEYGNLYYQRNDPASSLSFTTWVQEKAGHETKRSVPYEMKLVRESDGKVLAADRATLRLEPRWLQARFSFRAEGGDPNSYYKAGELLKEDGAYSFRFTLDGKPSGTYPFTVKGGRIQIQGRQLRDGGAPLLYITDYIAGGRHTSWWIKRQ